MNTIGKLLTLSAVSLSLLQTVQAANIDVSKTVDSHAVPWDATLNPTFNYGTGDGIGPVVFDSSDGFAFLTGDVFTISASGFTSAFGAVPADKGPEGDTSYVANDSGGSSGNGFPSFYVDSASYPAYLNALIGVFADSSGVIVGTPFLVGAGGSFTLPAGATQLQLGLNDDIFNDNTGSLDVKVSAPAGATGVPDSGASLVLLGMGCIGLFSFRKLNAVCAQ